MLSFVRSQEKQAAANKQRIVIIRYSHSILLLFDGSHESHVRYRIRNVYTCKIRTLIRFELLEIFAVQDQCTCPQL